MARVLLFILKLPCYLALLIVLAGIASLVLVSVLDVCPMLNEGGISCATPFFESIATFGMTIVVMTAFTLWPALLAMGGLVFLIWDLLHLRRKSATRP
jgi:hypothetical protein